MLVLLFLADITTWCFFFICFGIFISDVSFMSNLSFLLNYVIHMLSSLRIIYLLEKPQENPFWWTIATFSFTMVFDTFMVTYLGVRAKRDPLWTYVFPLVIGSSFVTITFLSLIWFVVVGFHRRY